MIQTYLPSALTEAELDTIINETIKGMRPPWLRIGFGRIMGAIMKKTNGRADPKTVNEKIRALLHNE